MKAEVDKLVSLLTDMLALYQEVLKLSKRKKAILVANDVKELNAITKEEEAFLVEISKLEDAHIDIVRKIADGHSLDSEQIVLSQVAGLIDEKLGVSLENLRRNLKTVALELRQMNELNTSLIKQASFFVNYNINLLTNNVADSTYAPQGNSGQTAHFRKLVDRKI